MLVGGSDAVYGYDVVTSVHDTTDMVDVAVFTVYRRPTSGRENDGLRFVRGHDVDERRLPIFAVEPV